MRLYDYLSSGNGYKVRLVLAQLEIPYQRLDFDIDEGETRTAEFLARNPNGKIPVLETDDGDFIAESNAIIFYLAEGTPLLPDDRLERAHVLQWMFFEQYSHEPNIATSRYIRQHLEMNDEARRRLAEKEAPGTAALEVMEGHLERSDYLAAGRYTIADVALYAYTHVAPEGGFDLGGYANIRAWITRVAAQPGHIPITQG